MSGSFFSLIKNMTGITVVISFLLSCSETEKLSTNDIKLPVDSDQCEASECGTLDEVTFYRRAFYTCGLDLDYGEPLPTIGALDISENIRNGFLLDGLLEVHKQKDDPFLGYSPTYECQNFSLDNISLVEVFSSDPQLKFSPEFFDKSLGNIEHLSSEKLSEACLIETYRKPFSDGMSNQLLIIANHINLDERSGLNCSAAAHLRLAGIIDAETLENYYEASGPLASRFKFASFNSALSCRIEINLQTLRAPSRGVCVNGLGEILSVLDMRLTKLELNKDNWKNLVVQFVFFEPSKLIEEAGSLSHHEVGRVYESLICVDLSDCHTVVDELLFTQKNGNKTKLLVPNLYVLPKVEMREASKSLGTCYVPLPLEENNFNSAKDVEKSMHILGEKLSLCVAGLVDMSEDSVFKLLQMNQYVTEGIF